MKEQNVLVIAIDPYIKNPVTGNEERASEYLDFSLNFSVSSLKRFIEVGTNGAVQINIADSMHLNEFPAYVDFPSMTEEQFLKLFPVNEKGKGEWYGWWTRNKEMHVIPEELDAGMHFDYQRLLNKCNLVELRKLGAFDMVWVFGIDPLSMYESAMIGDAAFWINGREVHADCENFAMFGMTFSRPDGALEDFCHMCECMMNYTYGVPMQEYSNRIQFSDFSELNTWQKFYLCQHNSPVYNKVYGVGQVHFSPNSTRDYEWQSNTPVQSYHRSFLEDYPNVTNKKVTAFTAGEYFADGDCPGDFALIRHHIWWMQHMPHYKGRDENGYRHNWWEYILDLKYVDRLEPSDRYAWSKIRIPLGETVTDISFVIKYNAGKKAFTTVEESGAVLRYKENTIFTVSDGRITALSVGAEPLRIMYDGHALEYTVEVYE